VASTTVTQFEYPLVTIQHPILAIPWYCLIRLTSDDLLIIGNYGTGKSHLMAIISSIAENAEYLI